MHIARIADEEMSPVTRSAAYAYRYEVFVKSLHWQLPCETGREQDEFDVPPATHLMAYEQSGSLVGYARLLPTTHAYLLATHFAHLLNGALPPSSAAIWELSRFAATEIPPCGNAIEGGADPVRQTLIGKLLLLEAIRFVKTRGCQQLLFCTTVGIERLAHRWGVEIGRVGAPQRSEAGLLIAARIECSDKTIRALSFDSPTVTQLGRLKHAETPTRRERDRVVEQLEA